MPSAVEKKTQMAKEMGTMMLLNDTRSDYLYMQH